MNAIYNLGDRLAAAGRWGRETLAGGELDNRQFNDFLPPGPLTQLFQPPNTVYTTHVLKDGADSVGALGALNRVFLNIGLFSEEWLRHFRPIIGNAPVTPITISHRRAAEIEADKTKSAAIGECLREQRSHAGAEDATDVERQRSARVAHARRKQVRQETRRAGHRRTPSRTARATGKAR